MWIRVEFNSNSTLIYFKLMWIDVNPTISKQDLWWNKTKPMVQSPNHTTGPDSWYVFIARPRTRLTNIRPRIHRTQTGLSAWRVVPEPASRLMTMMTKKKRCNAAGCPLDRDDYTYDPNLGARGFCWAKQAGLGPSSQSIRNQALIKRGRDIPRPWRRDKTTRAPRQIEKKKTNPPNRGYRPACAAKKASHAGCRRLGYAYNFRSFTH